jgi:DNA (cytosine-5)-methyltransferase 1
MTAFSRLSRFGMTFKPLTENRGEELLTLYLEAFRAKTSAPQEKAQELTENDPECGVIWRELLARYDPATSLWKTPQCSLLGDYTEFLGTWPRWGLMRDGVSFLQQTLVPPTEETEFGLLPDGKNFFHTPNTTGMDGGSNSRKALKKRQETWPTPRSNDAEKRGNFDEMNPRNGLPGAVKRWPTPRAQEPARTTKGYGRGLKELIEGKQQIEKWPTPAARDGNSTNTLETLMDGRFVDQLANRVKMVENNLWTTPCSRDWKGKTITKNHPEGFNKSLANDVIKAPQALDSPNSGQLNPTWVEKLMGWPDHWTSLQPISHVKMCFWFMGMHDGTKAGTIEVLRMLRNGDASQEVQRAIGRPIGISEAAFLLAELCEHEDRFDEARVFMACAEALEEEVRSVQLHDNPTSSSHRPEQDEQRTGEHPDAMQALSRLLAHYGQAAWKSGSWEDAIPRVDHGVAARVDRLKAIGNGQVPLVAATAWSLLK